MSEQSQAPDPKTQILPPLPGAPLLEEHIKTLDKSVTEWCEAHEIDRFQVQMLLKGELQRVSVGFAFDLEQATGGAIAWTQWIPTQDVRDVQRERRSAASRASAKARAAKERAETEAEKKNAAG